LPLERPAVIAAPLTALVLAAAQLSVEPGEAHPGDVVAVMVTGATAQPSGTLAGKELTFFPWTQSRWLALWGTPVDAKPGPLGVSAAFTSADGKQKLEGTVDVLPSDFPKREITLASKYVHPSKKEQAWSAEDQKAYNKALAVSSEEWGFASPFGLPRPLDVTAPFGDRRTINGKQQSQHFGTDLDGETGDPIYAANDGTVVMVRECFGSGNTVLIHHGGHLFTSYFHMSAFVAAPGQKVKRGDLLGKVGKTGRVTGPHLHFGAKLDGHWVNPMSLLKLELGAAGPERLSDRSTSVAASPETP
jgi:murein DD-endopeptidase MepM/ murein hydrolase activator NlpD